MATGATDGTPADPIEAIVAAKLKGMKNYVFTVKFKLKSYENINQSSFLSRPSTLAGTVWPFDLQRELINS